MTLTSMTFSEFDRSDLLIYEEVARMPPFQRKTLVLIGAQGVGRRTLKQRLIKADPSRFSGVTPREHYLSSLFKNYFKFIDYLFECQCHFFVL